MRLLVTGGCGFIGSAVVRRAVAAGHVVINVDKLTYASTLGSVAAVIDSPDYSFEQADIGDGEAMAKIFSRYEPDAVMHLAAESHVDRSIDGPAAFVNTNVVGTLQLLEAATEHFEGLPPDRRNAFRFHHVSTDEVFGSLGDEGAFTKSTPYAPRSPYSASKAAADHLVSAWNHTYGLPIIISNCSNNYGPFQFPEKLIPLMIISALDDGALPVYGTGENVRDWLYVEDHALALLEVISRGRVGETYLIGGGEEWRNVDVVGAICDILDEKEPRKGGSYRDLISFVADRPGHDHRYAIDDSDTRAELGWAPSVGFEDGLQRTVDWYLGNADWWEPLVEEGSAPRRLGLARHPGDGR